MASYGDFAYYYDTLTENVDYAAMSNYMADLLADYGVGEGILLDLACGTGTLSLMLSQRGYDVIGVDGSEEMLSMAQEKKMQTGEDVIFLCQQMQELDLFGTVNAAVCTLDSINHVTDFRQVSEIFRRVSLFMEDRGLFLFDVNTPYKHREILGDKTYVYDMDEVYCVWQNSTDDSLLTRVSLDIFEKDEEEDVYYKYSENFEERGYEIRELCEALGEYKFEVIGVFDEMTREPLRPDSQRAVILARKHGTQ